LLGAAACGESSRSTTGSPPAPTSTTNPCDPEVGTALELGDPLRISGRYATFTTDGSGVWATARVYQHGGVLDPEVGRGGVYVGLASSPPTYDQQTGTIGNLVAEDIINEGSWTIMDLPAGDYWLWTTSGSDVVIESCRSGGVSNPEPVR
jgi:hypothetical protein